MTKPEVDESDLEETAPDTRRLTILMPRTMYEDLRLEAEDARLLMGEHSRNIFRAHLAMTECDECGEDVPGDALFCPQCGVEFEFEDEESEKED